VIIQDAEIDKHFIYFLLAYYFGWTPKQVDEIDAYLVESLLIMLPEWKQKVQEIGGK